MEQASVCFEVYLQNYLKNIDNSLYYLAAILNGCEDNENPKKMFVVAFNQVMEAQGGITRFAQITGNGFIQDYHELLEVKLFGLKILKKIAYSLKSSLHVEEGLLPEEDAPVMIKPLEPLDQQPFIEMLNKALDTYADDKASLSAFSRAVHEVIELAGGATSLCAATGLPKEVIVKLCSAESDVEFIDFLCLLKALGLDVVFKQHN
jgi:DNA-binding phage protein